MGTYHSLTKLQLVFLMEYTSQYEDASFKNGLLIK